MHMLCAIDIFTSTFKLIARTQFFLTHSTLWIFDRFYRFLYDFYFFNWYWLFNCLWFFGRLWWCIKSLINNNSIRSNIITIICSLSLIKISHEYIILSELNFIILFRKKY